MKLYFARHGETNSNLREGVVSFDDRLIENGRWQARRLAERIAGLPIDLIVASPHLRTMETAQIIAKIIGKEIQESDLLKEKKWPSEMEGKLLNDPEVERVFALIREKSNTDPCWHYSDEENFLDVKQRARLFIEYVSGLSEKTILAVSHEYFIKLVIATMIFNDRLTYDMFRSFFHSTSLANASLSLCEKEQNTWKLVTLNGQK